MTEGKVVFQRTMLRKLARRVIRRVHRNVARDFSPEELAQSAVVVAPHPDDETLGCAGTVIRKRIAGADVDVVFMTDGAGSHAEFLPPELVARERHEEALKACSFLHVDQAQVTWFGYPDRGIAAHYRDAVARMRTILKDKRPAQIFVPFAINEHPDHIATRNVVLDALVGMDVPTHVFEYPIWFMWHWPWVSIEPGNRAKLLLSSRNAWFGLRLLYEFKLRVDVSTVVSAKRDALNAHRSQMEQRGANPRWQTLGDVSGGEFLANFFEVELFRPRRVR
jgi:LmbE family N-acetylglucosaminyl deacetylase